MNRSKRFYLVSGFAVAGKSAPETNGVFCVSSLGYPGFMRWIHCESSCPTYAADSIDFIG
jgi:hypothetical protein